MRTGATGRTAADKVRSGWEQPVKAKQYNDFFQPCGAVELPLEKQLLSRQRTMSSGRTVLAEGSAPKPYEA